MTVGAFGLAGPRWSIAVRGIGQGPIRTSLHVGGDVQGSVSADPGVQSFRVCVERPCRVRASPEPAADLAVHGIPAGATPAGRHETLRRRVLAGTGVLHAAGRTPWVDAMSSPVAGSRTRVWPRPRPRRSARVRRAVCAARRARVRSWSDQITPHAEAFADVEAWLRHSTITGHSRQIAFAVDSIPASAGPRSITGEKVAGSIPRHLACDCQFQ